MDNKIILASASPRRKELLSLITKEFTVAVSGCEEIIDTSLSPQQIVESLARQKAQWVYEQNPNNIVIGSDTIVVLEGEILGKPKDEKDAKAMLSKLSHKSHSVYTGVAILGEGVAEVFAVETKVEFKELTTQEINWYVKTGEPMDKAGSYGIQGYGSRYVKSITGDYYAVMGLPVNQLYENLVKIGINIAK